MSTEMDSIDESELGAAVESSLGALNGEATGTFVMSARIERFAAFRNVLLLMSLPEMEAITSIDTGNPLELFGGRDGKLFHVDRGDLVGERLDWERRGMSEFLRRDASEYGQSVVPPPPETVVFFGGFDEGEWRLGEALPDIGFPMRVGSSKASRRFTMTVVQFASYVQSVPGGQNIRTFGSVYRVVARESTGVESVTHILAAATNSSAPFFLRAQPSGAPQHLSVPIDLWIDENIGYMETDVGDRFLLQIEENLITRAFVLGPKFASVRRRQKGFSTRLLRDDASGDLVSDSYARGDWLFNDIIRGTPRFGFVVEEPVDDNKVNVPEHDPVLGDVFPIFTDPDTGAAWRITRLFHGMIRG